MSSSRFISVLIALILAVPGLARGVDPVAYYTFDRTLADSSGNGNDGTAHGGFDYGVDCEIDYSAGDFNGQDSYVTVPADQTIQSQTLTISTMVYINELADQSNTDTFVNKLYGSPHEISYELGAIVSTRRFVFGLNLGGTGYPSGIVESMTEVEELKWFHVAGTYDGAELRIYINGILENTVPYTQPIPYDGRELEIGIHGGYTHILDGRLNDLRIYDVALSEEEIAALVPDCIPVLVAYYPFDGDVSEQSGCADDGTVYGGLTFADNCGLEEASCAQFNGTDTFVLIPDSPCLRPEQLTLSAIVRVDQLEDVSNTDTFINKLYGSPHEISYELGVLVSSGKFIFGVNLGTVGYPSGTVESSTVVNLGEWYHVAGSYDGSTLRIYVNGVPENSEPYSYPVVYDGHDLELGAHAGYAHLFNGCLDEVRIFDSALGHSSILDYAECVDTSGLDDDPVEPFAGGRLAVWPNPPAEQVNLAFEMPSGGQVDLGIYDASGRIVRRIWSGTLEAGGHRFHWDGRSDRGTRVAQGVYFARVVKGGQELSTRIVVMR